MKVAITGKGGVGKTTLASTLARLYADEGRTVLAADVDPDANLGLALGLTEEEVNSIVPVSKMKQLAKQRTGANDQNSFYKLNPDVSDLPDKLAKNINGVKLLVMGTVDTGGTGCVCPEHVMLKVFASGFGGIGGYKFKYHSRCSSLSSSRFLILPYFSGFSK